jgi:hypothetical protein
MTSNGYSCQTPTETVIVAANPELGWLFVVEYEGGYPLTFTSEHKVRQPYCVGEEVVPGNILEVVNNINGQLPYVTLSWYPPDRVEITSTLHMSSRVTKEDLLFFTTAVILLTQQILSAEGMPEFEL